MNVPVQKKWLRLSIVVAALAASLLAIVFLLQRRSSERLQTVALDLSLLRVAIGDYEARAGRWPESLESMKLSGDLEIAQYERLKSSSILVAKSSGLPQNAIVAVEQLAGEWRNFGAALTNDGSVRSLGRSQLIEIQNQPQKVYLLEVDSSGRTSASTSPSQNSPS